MAGKSERLIVVMEQYEGGVVLNFRARGGLEEEPEILRRLKTLMIEKYFTDALDELSEEFPKAAKIIEAVTILFSGYREVKPGGSGWNAYEGHYVTFFLGYSRASIISDAQFVTES